MKIKLLLVTALALAGIGASYALADNGHGAEAGPVLSRITVAFGFSVWSSVEATCEPVGVANGNCSGLPLLSPKATLKPASIFPQLLVLRFVHSNCPDTVTVREPSAL